MLQKNLPEEIKYKLCKECFNSAIYFSNLKVVTLNEAKPCYAKHLRIWGEAGTVSMAKNGKGGNRGIPMIFIGDAKIHAGNCYHVYSPIVGYVTETRDIT